MNYTKGKWKIKEIPEHVTESEGVNFMEHTDEYQIIAEDGVTCIAVMGTAWASGQAINNAHLIAVAPDMYEALQALSSALMFLKGDLRKLLGDTEYDALSEAYYKGYKALAKAEGKGE